MPVPGTTIDQTFSIPSGSYTGAYWVVNLNMSPLGFTISTDGGSHEVTLASAPGSSNEIALSTDQLADVNAAAGSTLAAEFAAPISGLTLAGAGWILHLTAVGATVDSASLPWTELGISVPPDQNVLLEVSGTVVQGPATMGEGYFAYPEGAYLGDTTGTAPDVPSGAISSFPTDPSNWPAPNCNPWSLVFAVGSSMPAATGVTALQGDRLVLFSAAQIGGQSLWATFNDDGSAAYPAGYFDNVGQFTISYSFDVSGEAIPDVSVSAPGVGLIAL